MRYMYLFCITFTIKMFKLKLSFFAIFDLHKRYILKKSKKNYIMCIIMTPG